MLILVQIRAFLTSFTWLVILNGFSFLCLQLILVPSTGFDEYFEKSSSASFNVFKCYQMSIHKEADDEWSKDSYENFLVQSPIRVGF